MAVQANATVEQEMKETKMQQKEGTSMRNRKPGIADSKKNMDEVEPEKLVMKVKPVMKASKIQVCLLIVLLFSAVSVISVVLGFSYVPIPWPWPISQFGSIPQPRPLFQLEKFISKPPLSPRISIFVIGKSGTGKTTLAYGLLGCSMEEIERKTDFMPSPGISTEEINVKGVKVEVNMWISPEKDKSKLDDRIIEKIREVDFVLLTLRMDDVRIRPADKDILRNLSRIFGTDMWKKTVVALTYANRVDYIEAGKPMKSKSHFEQRKAEWIHAAHAVLVEEKIPHDLMCSIPMFPAGYFKTTELFGESWRDPLISGILSGVKKEAKKHVKEVLNPQVEATIPKSFCPNDE